MNKKPIVLALSIICILVLAGGSIAYFTATGSARNAVTTSTLDVELIVQEEIDGIKNVVSGNVSIMPGEAKSRIATVKNTGKEPAWIRLKVDYVSGDDVVPAMETSVVEINDINEADWDYRDGFWYYREELKAGETTPPVFTEIAAGTDIGNDLANSEMTLQFEAQGTQSKNNGTSSVEAKGWPESN